MRSGPKSLFARVAVGVVLLALIALGIRLLDHPEGAAAKAQARGGNASAVQVTTVAVEERDVPVYRAGVGTVAAAQSVVVHSRIDGQLERVGFVEGQDVKAGQVIAQLDPRTLQAQVAQAKAQEAKDTAQLANARKDLARLTQLIAEDAATQQQVDTQKALVAQIEAAIGTDQANLRFQQVQLSFATITAPISGRVGARLVDPGNIVRAADQNGLVVINQIDPVLVVFTLPEEAVQDVIGAQKDGGQSLQVQALARAGTEVLATGSLVLMNNQIDATTGTVQFKARFPNAKHALWPGQFVNVRLLLGNRSRALVVPEAAVQRSQDGSFVYVVDAEHKARNRPVQVAQLQDGIAVVTGVKAGDHVVVSGQYKIKPGSLVTEVPVRAASAARSAQ